MQQSLDFTRDANRRFVSIKILNILRQLAFFLSPNRSSNSSIYPTDPFHRTKLDRVSSKTQQTLLKVIMSSMFDQMLHNASPLSSLTFNQQIISAQALDVQFNAADIEDRDPLELTIASPPPRIHYSAYNVGYPLGTLRVFLPRAVCDPPSVENQHDHFSPHTYQHFPVTDLPDLLFRLEPPVDRFVDPNTSEDYPVPALYDATSRQQITTSRGDKLRYFSFLPRYIATHVTGALLEFWFRLDPRLEMNDVRMRIEKDATGTFPAGNTLQMHRGRFRGNIGAESWGASRTWPVKVDVEVLDTRTTLQICLNTTMIVDSTTHRLFKPTFAIDNPHCAPPKTGEPQQTYFDAGLAPMIFLTNLSGPVPSRKMMARIVLRRRLQELRMIVMPEGSLGALAYRDLPVADSPSWWYTRKRLDEVGAAREGRSIDEIDNMTHREYLQIQVGDPRLFIHHVARNKVRAINP